MQNKPSHIFKNLTDHYIQVDILARLATSEKALRFRDLKEHGLENSLFMYHANKLLNRGLIEKSATDGYSLTKKGAQWINFIGTKNVYPQASPRVLVQFILIDKQNRVLLSKRMGQLNKLVNDYLLPGGMHKYAQSADENIQIVATSITGIKSPELTLLTVAETIVENSEATYHSIAHVYTMQMPDEPLKLREEESYEYEWVPLSTIKQSKSFKGTFLQQFFTQLDTKTLKSYYLFRTSGD